MWVVEGTLEQTVSCSAETESGGFEGSVGSL